MTRKLKRLCLNGAAMRCWGTASGSSTSCRPLLFHGTSHMATITSDMPQIAALRAEQLGLVGGSTSLWELLEYNAHYFNPHRMAPILTRLLEEPPHEVRRDARLASYLRHARASVNLYENIKDLTAKDIATAITAARELGRADADELSDALVDTVAAQLASLSAQRVSFFITAFAKQRVSDAEFWRAAARAVADSTEHLSPQVLVSLFDAFRKSGLRSERLYTVLSHRVYGVLEDLGSSHIPPIVATICRVPLQRDQRERVLRALVGRWLSMLRREHELQAGTITMQQILSLTISLGLAPEDLNTAVFARDVSAFIGDRFDIISTEDLIVFLWGMQRFVVPGSLTVFFSRGLKQVLQRWGSLQATSQLSVQRLTQLSDVLVTMRHEGAWDQDMVDLQDAVLADLGESVQFCPPDSLAELLEIWRGNLAFWRKHSDFREAVAKRLEEILLESEDLGDVVPVLQAALGVPGLAESLTEYTQKVLMSAADSRGPSDVERIRAVLAGSPWEAICPPPAAEPTPSSASTAPPPPREVAAAELADGAAFARLLASWRASGSGDDLLPFLRGAVAGARGAEGALEALESAAPFAGRLAEGSAGEAFRLLEQLGDQIAGSIDDLPPDRATASLRACAVAGLPHMPLFAAALERVGRDPKPLLTVEARLRIVCSQR